MASEWQFGQGGGQLTGGGWGREGDWGAPGMELSTGSQTSAVPSAASWLSLNDAWPTSVRPVMGESKIHRSRAWRGIGWKCGCGVPVWKWVGGREQGEDAHTRSKVVAGLPPVVGRQAASTQGCVGGRWAGAHLGGGVLHQKLEVLRGREGGEGGGAGANGSRAGGSQAGGAGQSGAATRKRAGQRRRAMLRRSAAQPKAPAAGATSAPSGASAKRQRCATRAR